MSNSIYQLISWHDLMHQIKRDCYVSRFICSKVSGWLRCLYTISISVKTEWKKRKQVIRRVFLSLFDVLWLIFSLFQICTSLLIMFMILRSYHGTDISNFALSNRDTSQQRTAIWTFKRWKFPTKSILP